MKEGIQKIVEILIYAIYSEVAQVVIGAAVVFGIIANNIKAHPLALMNFDKLEELYEYPFFVIFT